MARRVLWALPPEIVAADQELAGVIDAALRDGEARAKGHLACRLGCTQCCIGPFDITALDAARLVLGLAELTLQHPGSASVIIERAAEQWKRVIAAFAGDPVTAVLSDDETARSVFFSGFTDMPSPALDPAGGSCLVYPWRPLSCRAYGLPVRYGPQVLEPCPLNFTEAPPEVVTAATVEPDADDHECRLLGLARKAGVVGETVVCAVLAGAAPGE